MFYVIQQHDYGNQNDHAVDKSACNGVHYFSVTLSVFRKTGYHRCLQTENASFLTDFFRQFHNLKSIFLLAPCQQFLAHMKKDTDAFVTKLWDCPLDELYLITPEYLTPYLDYIEQHKLLFRTATENAAVLGMDKSYERMFRHVFTPILDRYGIPQQDRPYLMAFYIQGLMAIISEWLKNDCTDSVEDVVNVIQRCVKRRREEI